MREGNSRMVDIVMIRTYEHDIIRRFAAHSRVPVINGVMTSIIPPDMGDIFTSSSNVEASGQDGGVDRGFQQCLQTWLQAAEVFDFNVQRLDPPGYEVEPERAGLYGNRPLQEFADPHDAVKDADPCHHDGWTSMGFRKPKPSGAEKRLCQFRVDTK